jgi:hypothetical protein
MRCRVLIMVTYARHYRAMTRFIIGLLSTLFVSQLASAKRIAPVKVEPVIYRGVRYVAPNDDGRRGYVEAWNVGTNKKLWELTIFTNRIDPNLEEDVQWNFIKALNIQEGRLIATSERGESYHVDLRTREITQSDSRPSPAPGATRDMPDAVKKALTNGSTGKKYDFSFRINPPYLDGDFNGDGKTELAVLVKERKVTILGAGIGIGKGGDDFEWMDSWQVYSKTGVAHAVSETGVPRFCGDALLVRRANPPAH